MKEANTAQAGLAKLTRERADVASGKSKDISSASKGVEGALNKAFGSSSDMTVSIVQGQIAEVQQALKDGGLTYNYNEAKIGSDYGRTVPFSGTVNLGEKFLQASNRFQDVTILHEFRHSFGANLLLPERYEGDALRNPQPWYSLMNADNFAIFVYGVGR